MERKLKQELFETEAVMMKKVDEALRYDPILSWKFSIEYFDFKRTYEHDMEL